MSRINSLQWRQAKLGQGDFTDSNNLASALMTQPEIYSTLAYAFGDKYYLQYLTAGSGRVAEKYKTLGNQEYMWPLMGDLIKPISIVGDSVPLPAATPGLGHSTFSVPMEEKYFFQGCIVKFGETQARCQDNGIQVGDDWIYTFQLVTDDPTAFVPATDLERGKVAVFMYTAFEEGSRGGGSFEAYPFWFKNQMTTMRMSYGMTGDAATDIMVLEVGKEGGKKSNLWMFASDYQKMLIWQQQVEYYRWYGKNNMGSDGEINLAGANGRPVRVGAGVLDQIASSNQRSYTTLTTDIMNDFLTDLQMAHKDAENRKLVMFTGAAGLRQFQDAINNRANAVQVVDTHFISKNGMGMTFNDQNWTTYKGILGTELTVAHLPLFDDRTKHTALHPESGLPLESYRMSFLDFSDYGGEANISMVTKGADGKNRAMEMWYTAGSTDPYSSGGSSGAKKVMRSSSLDGFECFYLSQQGMKVTNPLGCGELKLRVQG
jgi:hypothetical protein